MSDATGRYRQTVDSSKFSAKGMNELDAAATAPAAAAADAAQTGAPVAGDSPRLAGTSATDRLRRHEKVPDSARYRVDSLIGMGSTGQIYAVFDRSLQRPIAVKVLKKEYIGDEPDLTSFVEEARLTASITHPNVLPVHEFDVTEDGLPYFSMSRIKGRALDRIIGASKLDQRDPAIADPNAVVNMLIGVCNAVAYAHHQGILHQDIKPDNIMIGDFGEVLLLDWGSAARVGEDGSLLGRIYGTPLYMSPEQARRERSDRRSDIYCLGATLYHALTLRLPVWDDDPERFWERKRRGEVDPPNAAERAAIPAQLLGIALKAMAADPAQRYGEVKELVADLRAWQAGLAVSAYRDPFGVRLRRWRRKHARVLWATAAFAVVLIAIGVYLYGERVKEVASWGAPMIAEDFGDATYDARWTPLEPNTFALVDGRLVSKGERASFLVCNRRLTGGVAIEFEGTIPAGTQPGDLSVVWCEDEVFATAKPELKGPGVWFQVGAIDNTCAMIMTSPDGQRQSYRPLKLQTGRTYRIRAEIEGGHYELKIDGETVCSYDDLFNARPGYLALYGYYPGKAFDRVRIYNRGVAQKVSALAVGDELYRLGLYQRASESYQRVVDSQPDTQVADEGVYRQGLCQLVQGHWDSASACWSRVRDPKLRLQVQIHTLDHLCDEGRVAEVDSALTVLYRDHPELRAQVRNRWRAWISARDTQPPESLEPLVRISDRLFPAEPDCEATIGWTFGRLGRWQDAIKRYPNDGGFYLGAGRFDEAVERFANEPIVYCSALFNRAEFERALTLSKGYDWIYKPLLLGSGRIDQYAHEYGLTAGLRLMSGDAEGALSVAGQDEVDAVAALLQLGRREQALARADAGLAYMDEHHFPIWRRWAWSQARVASLVYLGRIDQALTAAQEIEQRHQALTAAAIEAATSGDAAAATQRAQQAAILSWSPGWPHIWFERTVVLPMLAGLGTSEPMAGLRQELTAAAESRPGMHFQRTSFFARLALGLIDDDAFLAQPFKPGAKGDLLLAHALGHDLRGEAAEAIAGYRAYLAAPMLDRGVDGVEMVGDPLKERLALWRVGALKP